MSPLRPRSYGLLYSPNSGRVPGGRERVGNGTQILLVRYRAEGQHPKQLAKAPDRRAI
jgi:hypothetical protein